MDKPALESGNLSGWSLRREVSGENFRLEADSRQGVGTGVGGSGEAWYLGLSVAASPFPQRAVLHSSELPTMHPGSISLGPFGRDFLTMLWEVLLWGTSSQVH